MLTIREVEQLLLRLFSMGLVRGTVHTCLGQEACAVGVIKALDPARDTVCSNHRGHGHFVAWTDNVRGLLAEVMGMDEGVCGGKGGSQHLYATNFYSNGILGGMAPVATGMAFAAKTAAQGGISAIFAGDGAMAEGMIYESLNIAALWKLPLLLVIEHNQYAQSTHWSAEHAGQLEDRPAAFGILVTVVDGNDVDAVFKATSQAVAAMRATPGPRCLLLKTYRMGPHSKGDDLRSTEELEASKSGDPLVRLERQFAPTVVSSLKKQVADRLGATLSELKVSMT
ncbi:MAG: thiamine pyrophosphate-dependent dehydrogenase E1 component subunit alpha [Verrucomicrobiaceae bacterium]